MEKTGLLLVEEWESPRNVRQSIHVNNMEIARLRRELLEKTMECKRLEDELKCKKDQLDQAQVLMIGRELRMKELESENEKLKSELQEGNLTP